MLSVASGGVYRPQLLSTGEFTVYTLQSAAALFPNMLFSKMFHNKSVALLLGNEFTNSSWKNHNGAPPPKKALWLTHLKKKRLKKDKIKT